MEERNIYSIDPDELSTVIDLDYSDAPDWSLPREWFIFELYDLEHESI